MPEAATDRQPAPGGTAPHDFDVIVVGGGAGGGTLAWACATAGKRVLLLERGERYTLDRPGHHEAAMLIEKRPYDDRPVPMNGTPRRLYVGGVLGGGTSLYGAALLRPSREDFQPGRHYGDRLPRELWDWPIGYDEMEPHYTRAERLYGLTSDASDDFGPLARPGREGAVEPLPLRPINRRLVEANRARGLRPFRLPLAIDPARCLRCGACPGYVCPNGSRRSSAQLVDEAVAAGAPLQVATGVEVEGFATDGRGQFDGVRVLDRKTGARWVYRARRYALAAGAIHSAALLMRSGHQNPHLGRHYMWHLSPIVAGVFPGRTGAEDAFVKQVGFADYYLGAPGFPHKLGVVQSLPVPGPLLLAKSSPLGLPRVVLNFLRARMLPLAGIVEDLPDPANRVTLGADGLPEVHHSFSPYDRERGRHLGRLMGKILRAAGALLCLTTQASDEHVAHQCGTLRFGTDPAHAVLDRDCRLFGQPGVFVVDGGFLPTSLGVGPALTIMANALRVAGVLTREA